MKLQELLQKMESVSQEIGTSPPFLCGGAVRDKYLKRLDNVADLDITTGDATVDYLSQEFALKLRKEYNLTRKTMSDGHSTIFIGNLKLDFSSNFVLDNIDALLAKKGIKNPSNMQKELFSRDFTCNTLLLTIDLKKIIDATHLGFKDINDKKIKTCLDPAITLTSNKNRVIRAIYLACKLDFEVDQSIIDYVKNHPESVKISTQTVLNQKLNEAFIKNPEKASQLLTQMNLWKYVPITEIMHPYYLRQINVK